MRYNKWPPRTNVKESKIEELVPPARSMAKSLEEIKDSLQQGHTCTRR